MIGTILFILILELLNVCHCMSVVLQIELTVSLIQNFKKKKIQQMASILLLDDDGKENNKMV